MTTKNKGNSKGNSNGNGKVDSNGEMRGSFAVLRMTASFAGGRMFGGLDLGYTVITTFPAAWPSFR
jgi:hypothetical protein